MNQPLSGQSLLPLPARFAHVAAHDTLPKLLRYNARNRGAAVLLISEDLDEILELADRVAVMSRGRLGPSGLTRKAAFSGRRPLSARRFSLIRRRPTQSSRPCRFSR